MLSSASGAWQRVQHVHRAEVAAGDETDVIIDGSIRIPAEAWQPIPGTSNPGYVSTNVVLREGE